MLSSSTYNLQRKKMIEKNKCFIMLIIRILVIWVINGF